MKYLQLLFITIFFSNFMHAQNLSYSNLWAKVENFEADGLPKSALNIVEDIEKLAKDDGSNLQFIKATLYKSKYTLLLEENAQLKVINNLKKQITTSVFPVKNILENVLANLYWEYFKERRYKFYIRTKTAKKVNITDFRTWDLQTLFNEIHAHYQASLKNQLMLQQEALGTYNLLLNKQKGSKKYRPTLFDLLNHNALEFYTTTETQITKPANKFEVDNPVFLDNANNFSKQVLTAKNSTSLLINALSIYKNLIQFHINNKSLAALAQVNIDRLKFVQKHASFSNKNELLLKALKGESENLKTHETSGLYLFEIASIYYQQSQTYKPKTNKKTRWQALESLKLCNSVITKFPKSRAAEKCTVLKSQIEQPSLKITAEEFLPIQKNARLLVRYKNLNNLKFNTYKLSEEQYETFITTHTKDEQLKIINSFKIEKTWMNKLKNQEDYQTHTTEVLLPKLDNGRYLITAFTQDTTESFAFLNIQVSNMALVETEANEKKIFQIINRNNGEPIANAKIEMSYKSKNEHNGTIKKYTTNNLGEIKIPKDKNWYRNVRLTVTNKNDIAKFGEFYINQSFSQPDKRIAYKSFLFTDRSIYRPGQTVYFKGIAIKTKNNKSDALTNEKISAILYNTNNKEVKQLHLVTNSFGSVAGEFILPTSSLNGNFRIVLISENTALKSSQYISVEEYKRPKFKTVFKPVTETYKINDSVTIKGNALAFAGSKITNAKVVYRVHRKIQYPRWYFWNNAITNSEPQEIDHGETTTSNQGTFKIKFKAIPDAGIAKSNLPIFNYEITADVTDTNGETQSATTVVKVGYHALLASLNIENTLNKHEENHNICIDTKNLNGQFSPAKGTIKIYKLKAPNTVIRNRPWNAPDYQEFSKKTFKKLFPNNAYGNEHDSSNWEKGKMVLEKPFNTKESKTLELGKIKKWESGVYLITLESEDKFGQIVNDKIKTTLFSKTDNMPADKQLFNISADKPSYTMGDTAILTIASAARNITVTISIEKDKKIISKKSIKLNANKKTITIPVTKADLGGFVVHYSFAAFNSFKSGSQFISVPYPKTDLEIETLTFRDKLQPGTNETWKFKIKGPYGEKVSTELLASMYDASLDQFKDHNWEFNPIAKTKYNTHIYAHTNHSFGIQNFRVYTQRNQLSYKTQSYDRLNRFGFSYANSNNLRFKSFTNISTRNVVATPESFEIAQDKMEADGSNFNDSSNLSQTVKSENANISAPLLTNPPSLEYSFFDKIHVRKNLQETAFFFPQLKTNASGDINFNFTTPEALTQWKLQLLAHTQTLASAKKTLTTVTQKELMVTPNAPRFLREGDKITFSSKISNLTETKLEGQATLILTNALTGKNIDSYLNNSKKIKTFLVEKGNNTQVAWELTIPEGIQAIQYKVIARAGNYSDGEQNALPVLSNRILVTETLPMWVKSNETKTFNLNKLKNNTSTTLKNHKLTLEITSNPAWYAVQALPYLMEYPYNCNEQVFSRYYANTLASHIANSNPRIQNVFKQWRNTDALLSNLEKNQELKSILIQETPWLRDAQSETEQKKRIALLFDLNKMNNEQQSALYKLKANQMPSGAWAWFNGGNDNRYITQHIITGFGHLNKLKVKTQEQREMIKKALNYLDNAFIKEYKDLKIFNKNIDLEKDHLSHTQLHYLYMRSFYPNISKSEEVAEAMNYYQSQIQKYWLSRSLYSKGIMALISHRNGNTKMASKILRSLQETSITSEELGMYWKANKNSWYWYQAPIETQALLIEAFNDIENNTETVNNLKIWLLKNKQTNRWKTTKATTSAIYALLLQDNNWLDATNSLNVLVGGRKIEASKLENVKIEAGTGYYKTSWSATEIKPEMSQVKLTKPGKGIAWGSLYWQYFEDLDNITTAETPLKLKKKLFLKKNTNTGEEISEINTNIPLKVGDLVRVRIELRSDRNMEFLHMKDMRASGLEPVNVISKYKWQDGLGYYESTKDASTNFFFDYLPKGIYIFEYDLRVNNAGNMSNGITTIQSMYAPEFSSHSEGLRIFVDNE